VKKSRIVGIPDWTKRFRHSCIAVLKYLARPPRPATKITRPALKSASVNFTYTIPPKNQSQHIWFAEQLADGPFINGGACGGEL
jgi:hypothetical protein